MLLLVVATARADTFYGLAGPLDRANYESVDGAWKLTVDPSQRDGSGPAEYTLAQAGVTRWTKTLPFTLWDAAVAKDGTIGGYAFTHGYNDIEGVAGSELIVALIDSAGTARVVERAPRKFPGMFHEVALPRGTDVFVDDAGRRLIVQVFATEGDGRNWWVYGLDKDGAKMHVDPAAHVPEAGRWGVEGAWPLRDVPLVLVRWARPEASDFYVVLGPEFQPVWQLEVPAGDRGDRDEPAPVLTGAGGFSVHGPATGKDSGFQVSRIDPGSPDGVATWAVAATGRSTPATSTGVAPEVPVVAPKLLGTITLRPDASAGGGAIDGILEFAFDAAGSFAFVRDSTAGPELVAVDPVGRARRVPLDVRARPECGCNEKLAAVSAGHWIVAIPHEKHATRFVAVDVDARSVRELSRVEETVESLAALREGGFVALTTAHEEYTLLDSLVAFDSDGKELWRVGEDAEGDAKLFSPEAVTVTTNDVVVVLENVGERVRKYGANGTFQSVAELKSAWGREPNYPTGIFADSGGGVIVHDFRGTPAVVRMDAEGKVVSEWTPRFADGHGFEIHGDVQRAADGKLWTSDGHALLELDESGVVKRVVGDAPDASALGRVGSAVIDSTGKSFLVDERSGAVHVFGPDGAELRVCLPDSGDYEGNVSPDVTVDSRGHLYVAQEIRNETPTGRIHYDASCRRVAFEPLDTDSVSTEWLARPDGGFWIVEYEVIRRLDADRRELRRIERTAAGAWIRSPDAPDVAPDGSLAFLSGFDPQDLDAAIEILTADGRYLYAWPVPASVGIGIGDIAWNGKLLAFALANNDGYYGSVAVAKPDGSSLVRFDAGLRIASVEWVEGRGGSELWLYDGERSIRRFAAPIQDN